MTIKNLYEVLKYFNKTSILLYPVKFNKITRKYLTRRFNIKSWLLIIMIFFIMTIVLYFILNNPIYVGNKHLKNIQLVLSAIVLFVQIFSKTELALALNSLLEIDESLRNHGININYKLINNFL